MKSTNQTNAEFVESLPSLSVEDFRRGVQILKAQMRSGQTTEEAFLFAKNVLFEKLEMPSTAVN